MRRRVFQEEGLELCRVLCVAQGGVAARGALQSGDSPTCLGTAVETFLLAVSIHRNRDAFHGRPRYLSQIHCNNYTCSCNTNMLGKELWFWRGWAREKGGGIHVKSSNQR